MSTRITVERHTLRFFAAHMATFRRSVEPLHGHNYAVVVECAGPLTEDAWVIDFGVVRRAMKASCDQLDHKFILQQPSLLLSAVQVGGSWEIIAEGVRRYVLPASDVEALPIRNSTTEEIARWLHGQFCERLRREGITTVESVTVGVEEAPGQTGWFTSAFAGLAPHDTVKER
jgi:6-pyruvoyltetrahydropterin/6-carboxytetrahydropterin synthase